MKIKRLCAVLLAAILCLAAVPASVSAGGDGVYETWDFDGSDDSVWTFIDGDGDGEGFSVYEYAENHFGLRSDSYDIDESVILTPDNYAISPLVQLTAAESELYLHWTAFGIDSEWSDEHYSLYVYTGTEELNADNIEALLPNADFSETLPAYSGIQYIRTVDLSKYMGKNVRFIFRHHDVENVFSLVIDSVSVSTTGMFPHVHQWGSEYICDDTYHWYNCQENGCDLMAGYNSENYEEHDWKYEYDLAYHWRVCKVCNYKEENVHSHNYKTGWDSVVITYSCDVCEAQYSCERISFIDLPITIDVSAFAGIKEPQILYGLVDTEKYYFEDITHAWRDETYFPITCFADGERYSFRLVLRPDADYCFPLIIEEDALQVIGIEWESTSVWINGNGALCFEGWFVFDEETGVPPAGGGSVPKPQFKTGDVNADGYIDSLDAAVILKYDAGIVELTAEQLTIGDVNNDGYVDSLDAAMILQYDAGIIGSF